MTHNSVSGVKHSVNTVKQKPLNNKGLGKVRNKCETRNLLILIQNISNSHSHPVESGLLRGETFMRLMLRLGVRYF